MENRQVALQQLSSHLYRFRDTCNVYAVRHEDEVVLIDFGSGQICWQLGAEGVRRVNKILMTHHHRDQAQGLSGAAASSVPIWVPHMEQELFRRVDVAWQRRQIMNNYNMRQDRFSLLEPVPIAGTLRDYATIHFSEHNFKVFPTPGHTVGSISLLLDVDGRRVAFSGDLIAAPGKVWSLAATQWTYNGAEGVAMTILSLLALKKQKPDILLPSHGEPIEEPEPAIDQLVARLWELLRHRGQNLDLFEFYEQPYEVVTPHLLYNRTSTANTYVLRSESGKALLFDFGYDFMLGVPAGTDRAARRPWLYTLDDLKQVHNITEIDVVIPTHFHDDHVAGFNLLREVEGADVWAAENMASILENPFSYNLPCLWYDPIPVQRVLPLGEAIRWQEYLLTLYPLPGHTRYAVAISLEVDGYRVLVTGDQYQGRDGLEWNYVYQNGFQMDDYRASAELYRSLAPDLILNGHWQPMWVTPGYFDTIAERGETLACLHEALLPDEINTLGGDEFAASIRPYQATMTGGESRELTVEVRNPFTRQAEICVELVAPTGWHYEPPEISVIVPALGAASLQFSLTPPPGESVRRARVAANVTIGGQPWGQQAEALVTVVRDNDDGIERQLSKREKVKQ